jgi:hypothetical protein
LQAKLDKYGVLLAYRQPEHVRDRWVIVGDTNFPNDYSPELPDDVDLADAWLAYHDNTAATYDSSSNSLAAAISHFDKSPQQNERIYYKTDSGMLVVDARIFGFPVGDAEPALRN